MTPQRVFVPRLGWVHPRAWHRAWSAQAGAINHHQILEENERASRLDTTYAFMVIVAAGIATIGLLFNSPAVIIGAMLISPLMSPIVSAGFAMATLDPVTAGRAARTLLLGSLAAVACAAAITALSPIRDLTPELLARTRPNLFDLAVAVLSGAAGGYATVRGRGGAIIGVAIATALMPPLAVVGYALATAQWVILRGATLLFVTNMMAIALAVASVAAWYGFGRGARPRRLAAQGIVALLVLVPLAVPLAWSLQAIAREAHVHSAARATLEDAAARMPHGQLAQFGVVFVQHQPPVISALIVADRPEAGLEARVAHDLAQRLGEPVRLRLTQLRSDDALPLVLPSVPMAEDPASARAALLKSIADEIPYPARVLDADADRRAIFVAPLPSRGVGLDGWKSIEAALAKHHAGWQVTLLPPPAPLPVIEFATGSATLDAEALARLTSTVWALQRWGVQTVQLTGHASSTGRGTRALAQRRVQAVGNWLAAHGVSAERRALYPVADQRGREREIGEAALRSVVIELPQPEQQAATART